MSSRFRLTPIWVPENLLPKRAKTTDASAASTNDVSMNGEEAKNEKASSEEADSDSSGSNSDFSSDDDSSEVSDLDKFEEAYTEFRRFTAGVDATALEHVVSGHTVPGLVLQGGLDSLHTLANVPKSWPLARLTIPLSGFSKQLERLIEGYCMEVMVTNIHPELQLPSIKKFAKNLVLLFAFHMADRISSLLRQVLHHPTKVLYDPSFGFFPSTESC